MIAWYVMSVKHERTLVGSPSSEEHDDDLEVLVRENSIMTANCNQNMTIIEEFPWNQYSQGRSLYYQRLHHRAIRALTQTLVTLRSMNISDPLKELDLLFFLIDSLIHQERYLEAHEYLSEARQVIARLSSTPPKNFSWERFKEKKQLFRLIQLILSAHVMDRMIVLNEVNQVLTNISSSSEENHFLHLKALEIAGNIHEHVGDLQNALKCFQKMIFLAEKSRLSCQLAVARYHQARVLITLGRLEIALESLHTGLQEANDMNIEGLIPYLYLEFARLYHLKADNSSARKYLKESTKRFKTVKDDIGLVLVLHEQAAMLPEHPTVTIAPPSRLAHLEEILVTLKHIHDRYSFRPTIELVYSLIQARTFMGQRRITSLAKASEILETLLMRKQRLSARFRFEILHQLSLIKMLEVSAADFTTSTKIEADLIHLLDQMEKLSRLTESKILQSITLLTKAKLSLLRLDLNQTHELMNQARKTAEQSGLELLKREILGMHDQVAAVVAALEISSIGNVNQVLLDNAQKSFLKEELFSVLRTNDDRSNGYMDLIKKIDEPIFILIATTSGLSVYFKHVSKGISINDHFLAGLLSIITILGGNAIKDSMDTEIINYQGQNMIIIRNRELMFCYAYKGSTYNAMRKLQLLKSTILRKNDLDDALRREITRLNRHEQQQLDDLVFHIFGF